MSEASLPLDAVPDIRAALLHHYDASARDLPWRRETDPYRIWVSEVMLQQTRVETVLGYYGAWLERFPDVDTLALADVDDVLKAWEGLGYYRRARNLHRGAAVVRENHGASLPDSSAALREIPGVGEYTAGAVASIAFGEVVPAVDGNVRRVLARLCDEAEPKAAWLRRTASALVDERRPGDWNQALMELGATVCTPRKPRCGQCPLAEWCIARAGGTQDERPRRPKKRQVPSCTFVTVVVVDAQGRVLLVRRPDDGLLAGLWSFPEGEIADVEAIDGGAAEAGASNGRVLARAVEIARQVGARVATDVSPRALPPVQHKFTHLHATYRPVLLRTDDAATGGESTWRPPTDFGELAMPVAQQKIGERAAEALKAD